MPPPGNKAPPFKTMDITAFLTGGNRKRKAPSPQICKSEPKTLKLSVECSENENDVEILDEACGIKVTLERKLDSSFRDCKENSDINAAKVESVDTDCKENKDINAAEVESVDADCKEIKHNPSKDELPLKVSSSELKSSSAKSPKSGVENDIEILSDKSKTSDSSSCDELNDSVNVSVNTSGLSATGEDDNEDKANVSNSKTNEGSNTTEKSSKEPAKKKKMTPAEAKKRAEEREKKQQERMLKKQEIENKKKERLLEKERKMREKMVKKEREELEKKERERLKQEKKEQEEREKLQKQKEKEEKLKLKQMLLEQKLEEKRKKEEMKQKREEELKRAEEEKLEKEQKEKEKKEREKAAFAKFFLKGEANTSTTTSQVADKEGAFLPFQISEDMTLAPVVPPIAQERFDKKQLDHYLEHQDGEELYLQILKSVIYQDVRQRKKNRKLGASEADIIVIDENAQAAISLHPKLLQFQENVRPAYWGTWRKKSKNVGPRKPFGQDEVFDYDVDSDDEWDEGGPGESLSGTEQEDVESEDEYEVDNEFFVPHGYLSDEEEKKEDDDEEVNDPEKQKALLKIKLQQFEMERKKKTTELKPIMLGCYFVNNSAFQDSGLEMFLQTYSAELLTDIPIPTSFTPGIQQADNKSESPKQSNGSSKKKKYLQMPEEAFPQLIRLVHGNTKNRRTLAEEFQKYWVDQTEEHNEKKMDTSMSTEVNPGKEGCEELNQTSSDSAQISLTQLRKTIKEIASYGKPPESCSFNKCCWWVHDDIREKYGLIDAPVPNQWKYASQKELEPPVKVNCPSIKEFLSSN